MGGGGGVRPMFAGRPTSGHALNKKTGRGSDGALRNRTRPAPPRPLLHVPSAAARDRSEGARAPSPTPPPHMHCSENRTRHTPAAL